MEDTIKCVVVGDYKVGKTCLVLSYTTSTYPAPEEYLPVVYDMSCMSPPPPIVTTDGTTVHFKLLDTPGTEYQDRLRPLNYPHTNVFILCFSLVDQSTFQNVKTKWFPVLNYWCPHTPIILVGTKLDMRDDAEQVEIMTKQGDAPVSMKEGMQMKDSVKNIVSYVECSSLTGQSVLEVFKEAAHVGLAHKLEYHESDNSMSCCIVL